LLVEYQWPGNVRELRNVIERSVVFTAGNYITVNDLPDKVKPHGNGGKQTTPESTLKVYINDYEKELLLRIYNSHDRNKDNTARALGIDLATLYRKFKKYGIAAE